MFVSALPSRQAKMIFHSASSIIKLMIYIIA